MLARMWVLGLLGLLIVPGCSDYQGLDEPIEVAQDTDVGSTHEPAITINGDAVTLSELEDLFPYDRMYDLLVEQHEAMGNREEYEFVHALAVPDGGLSEDDLVIAQAYMVLVAAEEFAEHNGGIYPRNLEETDLDSYTLIDYLPGGDLLVNL